MLCSQTGSEIRLSIFNCLKNLAVFTLNLLHHLLGIRFQRPRKQNSGTEMLEEKSLDRNKVFIARRPDDRQVKCQIRFHSFRDREVRPRSGGIHFAKEFNLLRGPPNRRDARGGRVEAGPDFQQLSGIGEIAGVEPSELEISYYGARTNMPAPFRICTRPSDSTPETASRTADRLTPNFFASSLSDGSLEPGANSRAVATRYSAIASGSLRVRLVEEMFLSDISETIAESNRTGKAIKRVHMLVSRSKHNRKFHGRAATCLDIRNPNPTEQAHQNRTTMPLF